MRLAWLRFRFLTKQHNHIMEEDKKIDVDETRQPDATRPTNKLGRVALWVAIAAWVVFILSGFLPYSASLASGAFSVIIAAVAFVMGLVSLRRKPRTASIASLVHSGVILVIFILALEILL